MENEDKNQSIEKTCFKKGEKFMLECNHEGKIVWVSQDKKTFGVKGVKRSCRICGKNPSSSWTPFVYLMVIDEVEEND